LKHIVGFSGGIDSQAVYRWLRNRYAPEDVIALNSQAGRWENKNTVDFVAEYSRTIAPVIEVVPLVKDIWITDDWAASLGLDGEQELTMELLISIKNRPPSRKAKFCTEILKLRPQKRWMQAAFGIGGQFSGEDYARYAGIRRDESPGRRNTPIEQWDGFFDCQLISPVADWTKRMCFEYVKAHGEPVNPLYSMGAGRVGCMPCVDDGKEEIVNIDERFPEEIDKTEGVEQRTGKTFFMPKFQHKPNNIREVVEWARTARGGRQQIFPILHEREACESKYGLCE
jgi:3'-phosphoadenosine 5'-phosphosulfate sulfotransferase (PAPS reductase)/FAD synthetase